MRKGSPETRNRNFTSVFGDRTSFRAKGLRPETRNRNFTSVFGDRTSFRAKGLRLDARNRNFTAVFGDRTSFRAKAFAGNMKSQFNLSFRRSKLISCERVRRKHEIAILPQFLAIEPHFVRKRSPETRNRNFTSVFGDRTSFRAKGFRPETRNRNFTLVFGD